MNSEVKALLKHYNVISEPGIQDLLLHKPLDFVGVIVMEAVILMADTGDKVSSCSTSLLFFARAMK
jgi:hypothetical protein